MRPSRRSAHSPGRPGPRRARRSPPASGARTSRTPRCRRRARRPCLGPWSPCRSTAGPPSRIGGVGGIRREQQLASGDQTRIRKTVPSANTPRCSRSSRSSPGFPFDRPGDVLGFQDGGDARGGERLRGGLGVGFALDQRPLGEGTDGEERDDRDHHEHGERRASRAQGHHGETTTHTAILLVGTSLPDRSDPFCHPVLRSVPRPA